MRDDLNNVRADPAFVLKLPGCFVLGVNDFGEDYFARKSGKSLRRAKRKCLCDVLGAPNAYLAQFCPIEVANIEAESLPSAGPFVLALGYDGGHRQGARAYELFFMYLRRQRGVNAYMRLLPFPEEYRLSVWDIKEERTVMDERLRPVPRGIVLEVPTLVKRREYGLEDRHCLERLHAARQFFIHVLAYLDEGVTPHRAWRNAARQHAEVSRDVPRSVADVFYPSRHVSKQNAIKEIVGVWENPLDAPVFMGGIFHKLAASVQEDAALRFLPRSEKEELRYLRLRLPLRKLEEQDEYVGWLPLSSAYAGERAQIRDELL